MTLHSNIIGISGKKGSGKDTVGEMIRSLLNESTWEIKKYADKLKDITCLLIGCTRKQLEDEEFKNTPLSHEWDYWHYALLDEGEKVPKYRGSIFTTLEEALEFLEVAHVDSISQDEYLKKESMTPRLLLQILGTEGGRELIHPNIWINSLWSDYRDKSKWIITDVRFPNEVEAIKNRGGVVIRVNRPKLKTTDTHASETALDDYTDWDYIVENYGTLNQLLDKITILVDNLK